MDVVFPCQSFKVQRPFLLHLILSSDDTCLQQAGKATNNNVFVTECILKGVFGLVGLGDVR